MKTRLDISIGPVQGFVSQSRRTRDLWGSSYLLAFLSAHAMSGATDAGGEIIQPRVEDDPLYLWVRNHRDGSPPTIGTVPNHFVVSTENCDPTTVADAAVNSLQNAWQQVCRAVRQRFLENALSAGNGTSEIWDRQTSQFWEVVWTAGPAEKHQGLLARRKHWRSHRLPDEPGDKCTVMHDLQELSGFVRARDREKQELFWDKIRARTGELDLRHDERLCAIALVKRLFPKAPKALDWSVAERTHWPSTAYVGAVPWLRRVVSVAPKAAKAYAQAVNCVAEESVFPLQQPPFQGLGATDAGDFPKLDANYMNADFVRNARLCPLREDAARQELVEKLESLYKTENESRQLGKPPLFYALLLADGDRLGKLVSEAGGDVVGQALAAFTRAVPPTIRTYDGVPVYAGGDDVLAMLPVQRALACAHKISDSYKTAFAPTGTQAEATLSAAVVFAHVRLPLRSVLNEAHRLLDDVAKDGNGRNSLAVGVLKSGGRYCQWVSAWDRHHNGSDHSAVTMLGHLVRDLEQHKNEPGLSSALIYRLREALATLCGWDQWEPGNWGTIPDGLELGPFLRAEIQHSLASRLNEGAEEHADLLADHVAALLSPARNSQAEDRGTLPLGSGTQGTEAGFDALLLARFLADPDDLKADR